MIGLNEALSAGVRLGLPLLSRVQRMLTVDSIPESRRNAVRVPVAGEEVARKLSVLVADDNPLSQQLVSKMLSSLGIQPLLAENGAEAVALARAHRLDFILMDIQMPVLDGLGATRKIRQHEVELSRPRVPVVAYTSISAHAARLRENGMDGVLYKPCKMLALRECLAQWCASGARELNLVELAVSPCH